MLHIELVNQQAALDVDERRMRAAVERVLADESVVEAEISLAVVDDDAIHDLNRRFLDHDEPTDVLSFVLDQRPGYVEGQIVVSAETAVASARRFGWAPADELLLYVVHGALHLVGYDDTSAEARAEMRKHEVSCLAHFGLVPRYAEEKSEGD